MSGDIVKSSAEHKHEGDVTSSCFYNNIFYTSGADGKIKLWDIDLNLKKEINAHDAYIYSIAIDVNGKLYSCSNECAIKMFPDPINSDKGEVIVRCDDDIAVLATDGKLLLSGDDKGIVTTWIDGKIKFKYNLVEEVRGLACQNKILFTVRDKDVIVTYIKEQSTEATNGMYSTRITIPGSAPICLIGSNEKNEKHLIAFASRGGKGILLVKFQNFETLWTIENAHEMIINAICGTDDVLYTAGWDGKVKKWTSIKEKAILAGEVDVGCCVNTICCAPDGKVLIIGGADGIVRKITFSC